MKLSERNRKIDELAYNLKFGELSEGKRMHVQDELVSLLMEYRGISFGNNADDTDISEEKLVQIEYIEDAYNMAWQAYLEGEDNETFRNTKGSFIFMFNSFLKFNLMHIYKDVKVRLIDNFFYDDVKDFVKMVFREIKESHNVKMCEEPSNFMNLDSVIDKAKKIGATDEEIDRLRDAFDINHKVSVIHVDDEDGSKDIDAGEAIGDGSFERENSKLVAEEYFVKLCKNLGRLFDEGRAEKLYCKYFLNCKIAKTFSDDEDLENIKVQMGDLLDFDFIRLYRKKYSEEMDIPDPAQLEKSFETKIVADYLGKEYETVQRQIKAIRDKFEEIRIKHLI